MVDAKVLEAVNFFSVVVRENGIHIHDLIVFGSSGLGTASPHSDIDIAIVSGDFTKGHFRTGSFNERCRDPDGQEI